MIMPVKSTCFENFIGSAISQNCAQTFAIRCEMQSKIEADIDQIGQNFAIWEKIILALSKSFFNAIRI
jgi:hypothetical protein